MFDKGLRIVSETGPISVIRRKGGTDPTQMGPLLDVVFVKYTQKMDKIIFVYRIDHCQNRIIVSYLVTVLIQLELEPSIQVAYVRMVMHYKLTRRRANVELTQFEGSFYCTGFRVND